MVDKPVIAEGGILPYFIFRQISILNIDFVFLLYPNFSKTLHLNPGSLTVGYQKKVPAGRIKPAFFVSNFWFLSIVFYCNVL